METIGCSKCGSAGIHACPGGKAEWSPEKIAEFAAALGVPQEQDEPTIDLVKIDLARMQAVLASGEIIMPRGLSREEKRAFIIGNAPSLDAIEE